MHSDKAKKLIEQLIVRNVLTEQSEGKKCVDGTINNPREKEIENCIKAVEEQPTAYDVDAVVEQLEELKSRYGIEDFGIKGIICKAIEIVKGGGVK